MNTEVDPTSSNLASAMLNSKIRPRAVVGHGGKIFHPSPPNYVTRSPGWCCVREEEVTEAVGHQPNGDHLQDAIARVWALFFVPMNKIHFSKVSQSTGDICSHLRQF